MGSPKFIVLNRLLSTEPLDSYDFIIISDDDISLSSDFLDRYLSIVVKHDFAIAQPARTHSSYIDHHFVEQLTGLEARRTRFVEIGPLFSVRRDVYPVIFPFDESTYMGWGYDFVRPCLMEKLNKRMGIVDATPVEHRMRKSVKNYKYDDAKKNNGTILVKKSSPVQGGSIQDTGIIFIRRRLLHSSDFNLTRYGAGKAKGNRMKQPQQNWLYRRDIVNFLFLVGFDVYKGGDSMLLPLHVPLVSKLMNKYLTRLAFFRKLCLSNYAIAKPLLGESDNDDLNNIPLQLLSRFETKAEILKIPF